MQSETANKPKKLNTIMCKAVHNILGPHTAVGSVVHYGAPRY